jgi:hypothetical protein
MWILPETSFEKEPEAIAQVIRKIYKYQSEQERAFYATSRQQLDFYFRKFFCHTE